jgi:hypothetical protein
VVAALLIGQDDATSAEAGGSAARTVAAFVVLALAAVALLSAQYAEVAEMAQGTGCGSRRTGAGWPMVARAAPIAAEPDGQAG